MVKIIIVRHGYSVTNKLNKFTGHTNPPLSETGLLQAKIVSDYLYDNFDIDKIYSSDLNRATDTVKPLADKLAIPITTDEGLRELYGGVWEDMYMSDIKLKYEKEFSLFVNDLGNSRCVGGESFEELQTRFYNAVYNIAKQNDGKTIVICAHACAICSFECKLNNVSKNDVKDVPYVKNASVSLVLFDNDKFLPQYFDYSDHLQGLITALPTFK